jgi:hypothetical protein
MLELSRDDFVNFNRRGGVWNKPENAPEPIFIVVHPTVSLKAS